MTFKPALIAFATAFSLNASAVLAEKWDMPMAYAASNYHSEHGVMFADKVKEYTNGDLEITVHAGGSLFGGADIKRAIQTGQAPIGERIMSAHANEEPLLNWDNQPFLATSYKDSARLWEAAKDTVNETLSDMNLVALYTCPWPGQGFYFKEEVGSSTDVKGLKLRSYNAATATVIEMLGGTPVQIEAAELTQALATGVADGFISSGSTGYDRKVWEHLSHYYKVNAWLPRNYVMVNKGVWEALDGDTQAALQKAADETGASCIAKSEELSDWYFEQLEANGMTVTDAGPEFLAELQEIGATMQADWLTKVGDKGQTIIDAYSK